VHAAAGNSGLCLPPFERVRRAKPRFALKANAKKASRSRPGRVALANESRRKLSRCLVKRGEEKFFLRPFSASDQSVPEPLASVSSPKPCVSVVGKRCSLSPELHRTLLRSGGLAFSVLASDTDRLAF
jgi:hypothetical protein